MRGLQLWLLLFCASACSGQAEDPARDASPPFSPETSEAPRVHPDNSQLLYRFMDRETGELTMVTQVNEVPEEVRKAVLVMDLDPAQSHHPRALFVADLSTPLEDGSYPVRVLDRFEFEAAQNQAIAESSKQTPSRAPVVMFSAEWCGACKQAAKWLRANNIPFKERDVEKDPKALPDLKSAARRAGMTAQSIGGSVPVFVVGTSVQKGFNPSAIQEALQKQK